MIHKKSIKTVSVSMVKEQSDTWPRLGRLFWVALFVLKKLSSLIGISNVFVISNSLVRERGSEPLIWRLDSYIYSGIC